MGSTKIFISHSTFDKEIAEDVVNFLVNGVGINESTIFCSSMGGNDIPLGVNFNEYILEQLKGDEAQVLSLVSNNYYNSKFCLYELGAAWGLGKKTIIPILLHSMKHGELQDFIAHQQAVTIDTVEGVNKLADHLKSIPTIELKPVTHTKYERARSLLISNMKGHTPVIAPKNALQVKIPSLKYKAVAFDFDGTILLGDKFQYSWQEIWHHLGYDDKLRRDLYNKHRENPSVYTFQMWCDECGEYFMSRGFSKMDIHQIIRKRGLRIADGFEITIKNLKELGFKLAIISGGIDTFIEATVSTDILEMFDEIYINSFQFTKGGKLRAVKAYQNTHSDSTGKVAALERFCLAHKLNSKEVVYVGEGNNDCDVATEAGLALSFPAATARADFNNLPCTVPILDSNMAAIIPKIFTL